MFSGASKLRHTLRGRRIPSRRSLEQHHRYRSDQRGICEFQKILDHRGVTLDSLVGPLSRVGLARAYVLQGDVTRARAAYEDFFNLWKDADPDIPILKQARAESAKLLQ